MALPKDWKEFIGLFNAKSVDFVLVGAFAVSYHSIPRNSGDIDFLIYPSPQNAERVVEVLREFGFGSLELSPQDFLQPDQYIQLGYAPNRIDLMTSITGVDIEEIWSNRVPAILEGLPVWMIGREQLIKNKKAVGRKRDKMDLEALGYSS